MEFSQETELQENEDDMKLGKMKYRGTIVVDIDGVIADCESKFCEDFGYDNRSEYSFFKRYPNVDPDLISEWLENPSTYSDLAPIFGGTLLCRQAHQRGWYILLVTARDKNLREVTRNWLSWYSVQYHEIIFAKNKDEAIRDWENWNKDKPVSIVVDDCVEVLESMPEKYCVAWKQPWNKDRFDPYMLYSTAHMKILLRTNPRAELVGVWDKAGK